MDDPRYTIQDLSDLSGFSRRAIRYYVEQGLIDPPAGRGRGGYYYDSQLDRLLAIKALREQGFRLSAIAERLDLTAAPGPEAHARAGAAFAALEPLPAGIAREEWVQYEIAPWLRVEVRRDIDDSAADEIEILLAAARAVARRKGGTP